MGDISNNLDLISVVIPMYNGAGFIEKTVESVLRQNYSNIELIVVDNCSTDNSAELVRKFADPRVHLYINETNIGLSGNLNRGISLSHGKYIKFLCADDELKPNCIEEFLKIAENGHDVIYCNCDYIDKDNNIIVDKAGEKKDFVVSNDSKSLNDLFVGKHNILCCVSFLMIKNGCSCRFEEVGGNSYNSDLLFMFSLINEYGHLYYTSDKLINLRRHSTQGTYKSDGNEIFKFPLLFRKTIIEKYGLTLSRRQTFKYRFSIFKNGVNAFVRYRHIIPSRIFKYTISEFGFHYYLLLFGLYFPFVYIPKKLFLGLLSVFKRRKHK